MGPMSTQKDDLPAIPPWTLGWRLQRALSWADISAEEISVELEVHRSTVSRWMNDRGAPPRALFVKEWALRCGVPYDWLAFGIEPQDGPDGGAVNGVSGSACTSWGQVYAFPAREPELAVA